MRIILWINFKDYSTYVYTYVTGFLYNRGWGEAEKLFKQVMVTFKTVLGQEHPSTLTTMANLAATFWNQGRRKEAEELEVQAMETRKRVLG